jgi:hypothetical protein
MMEVIETFMPVVLPEHRKKISGRKNEESTAFPGTSWEMRFFV